MPGPVGRKLCWHVVGCTAWDPCNQASPKSIVDTVSDLFGMLHEYEGLIPGNAESTAVMLQLMNVYYPYAA
jgi:hypothetical protein